MKKNGFTLIELLVVVAIIGILAAVGIVAYSGYTTNAKKNTIKTRHDTIVKFFKAEFERCNINEEVYLANVNEDQCYRITDPTKRNLKFIRNLIISHINDTMEWKNVYDRNEDAATNKKLNNPNCDLGQICVKRDNINQRIIIVSNYDDNENYLTSYLELGD